MHTVGLPWYAPATYVRAIALMEDRAEFPSAFEAWRREAELRLRRLESEGIVVYRVIIDPEEFAAWCRRQDVVPNATARERFAEIAARHLFREEGEERGSDENGEHRAAS